MTSDSHLEDNDARLKAFLKNLPPQPPHAIAAEKINPAEFEAARRCMIRLYHTYNQTHAGYLIAIGVGALALFSNIEALFKFFSWIGIGLIFGFLICLFALTGLRVIYWSTVASLCTGITSNTACFYFNLINQSYFDRQEPYYADEAPYTRVIEESSCQVFFDIWHKQKLTLRGLALLISRQKRRLVNPVEIEGKIRTV